MPQSWASSVQYRGAAAQPSRRFSSKELVRRRGRPVSIWRLFYTRGRLPDSPHNHRIIVLIRRHNHLFPRIRRLREAEPSATFARLHRRACSLHMHRRWRIPFFNPIQHRFNKNVVRNVSAFVVPLPGVAASPAPAPFAAPPLKNRIRSLLHNPKHKSTPIRPSNHHSTSPIDVSLPQFDFFRYNLKISTQTTLAPF